MNRSVKKEAKRQGSGQSGEGGVSYEQLLEQMKQIQQKKPQKQVGAPPEKTGGANERGDSDDEVDLEGSQCQDEEGEFQIEEGALDDEQGEEDMMDELGEEELEDPDDGINFNHPSHASQALNDPHSKNEESSDDEEDNIVSKTIKQKQEAAQRKQPLEQLDSQINSKSANKKQKTGNPEDSAQIQGKEGLNTQSYLRDMDAVQQRLGKQSELPADEKAKTLTVDFEYVTPSEPYFHFVKTLLITFLDGQEQEKFNASAMADHVLERASIGSVIASSLGDQDPEKNPEYADLPDDEFEKIAQKCNAERDVYGFISMISLTWSWKKLDWLSLVYKYICDKADKCLGAQPNKLKDFKALLEGKNVGLLVSERLVNMPPDVVPDLHSQLPDDLAFTKQQDDIVDAKEFAYEYLLIMTRFTVPNEEVTKDGHKKEDRLYYHWEDQVFEKHAVSSFHFLSTFKEVDDDGAKTYIQGACSQAGGGKETQFRMIYLIKWSQYVALLPKLEAILKAQPVNKK